MSVAGYLSSDGVLGRMSRAAAGEVRARFEGAVLCGELSVAERFVADAARVVARGETCYREVGEYDAVLRAHCRLSDRAGNTATGWPVTHHGGEPSNHRLKPVPPSICTRTSR